MGRPKPHRAASRGHDPHPQEVAAGAPEAVQGKAQRALDSRRQRRIELHGSGGHGGRGFLGQQLVGPGFRVQGQVALSAGQESHGPAVGQEAQQGMPGFLVPDSRQGHVTVEDIVEGQNLGHLLSNFGG